MQRRALLRKLGGVTAIGAVAGCTSVQAPGTGDQGDPTTTDPGTTPSEQGPVVDELTVGNRDDVDFPENHLPHELVVINNDLDTRELGVELSIDDGTTVFEDTWFMPPQGRVQIELREPAQYSLSVNHAGTNLGTVSPKVSYFDCNSSRTSIEVNSDGELDTTTIQTLVACAPAEVERTTFTVTETDCGGSDHGSAVATIGAEDEAIRISGAMAVPNPCHGATLESATVGERPGNVLTVRIAQTEPEGDGVCVECVGVVEYDATISLARDYPREVVLEYRHMGELEEVARVPIDE